MVSTCEFLSVCTCLVCIWLKPQITIGVEGAIYKIYIYICLQAHAAGSHVLIVGTFLDFLDGKGREKLGELKQHIRERFPAHSGYPYIADVVDVSCKTKEGINQLRDLIYLFATGMDYHGNLAQRRVMGGGHNALEKIIGRMVNHNVISDVINKDFLQIYLPNAYRHTDACTCTFSR